ncbi:MAG: hypothetical protein WD208_00455 [Dehalococcoidia bacterium]
MGTMEALGIDDVSGLPAVRATAKEVEFTPPDNIADRCSTLARLPCAMPDLAVRDVSIDVGKRRALGTDDWLAKNRSPTADIC